MRKVLFVMCLLVACKKEEAAPAAKPSAEPPPAEAAKAEVKEEAREAKEAPATGPLAVGATAPDFSGTAQNGQTITLSQYAGAPVVVYFYPKDGTPGCTVEAQNFRDATPALDGMKATVIGISLDDEASHQAFAKEHRLGFPLIADPKGEIAAKYGVDTSGGFAKRTTFVIDKQGKVARVFADVKVDGHSDEVLAAVKELR